MKKNRKIPRKMSVCTTRFMHLGVIIFTLFIVVIMNLIASSNCQQLERMYGKDEEKLKKLEDDFLRETARWETMKTSEGLESALRRHGLSMHYPNACQTVRMRPDGKPRPGQLSLAKIAQREKGIATANYPSQTRRRR